MQQLPEGRSAFGLKSINYHLCDFGGVAAPRDIQQMSATYISTTMSHGKETCLRLSAFRYASENLS